MKPKRIILVRHAQSSGNLDKSQYETTPDYAIPLTELGKQQALECGAKLNNIFKQDIFKKYQSAFFYVSSYRRTKETFQGIAKRLDFKPEFREDCRLIEQEWQSRLKPFDNDQQEERDSYGSFYYRFNGGESCSDCVTRVSSFLDTLWRDFEKPNYPANAVIVSHGMLIRVLLMRWFHMTVEEFEVLRNPKNCAIIILNLENGKYKLEEPLEKYPTPMHQYHYPLVIS